MSNTKKLLFLASLASFAAAMSVFETGFKRWTPVGQAPEGGLARYDPNFVSQCAQYRARAFFLDDYAAHVWRVCRASFFDTGSLAGFNVRYWALISLSGTGVLALFAFALAARMERPKAKVVRGRRYLTGGEARAQLRSACAAECRRGLPRARDETVQHWL